MPRRAIIAGVVAVAVVLSSGLLLTAAQGQPAAAGLTLDDVRDVCKKLMGEFVADIEALRDDMDATEEDVFDLGDRMAVLEEARKAEVSDETRQIAADRLKTLELQRKVEQQAREIEDLKGLVRKMWEAQETSKGLPLDPALQPAPAAAPAPQG